MTDKEKDLKTAFIISGLAIMVLACLLTIFVDMSPLRLTALVILFLVGFGCCVAGTDTTEAEKRKAARKSEQLDEWQRPEGPF